MPELPEVQTTVDGLRPHIVNQQIINTTFYRPNIRYPLNPKWISLINEQTILSVDRRAKMIIMQLENSYLLWHLGMSGSLRICSGTEEKRKHDHIEIKLSNQKIIRYHDPRRFGYFKYYPNSEELLQSISHYGIEPLSDQFSGEYLYKQCIKKTIAIKNLIMNQHVVVGVGNIYACEALFYSQINPISPANKLSKNECSALVKQIKNILKKAIKQGGTTLKDFENADAKPGYFQQTLAIYGRKDLACLVCNNKISSLKIGGRNTFFCTVCQTNPQLK